MDTLPNDMIILIFETILKITDKRQFLRTCVMYNKLTEKSFSQYEDNYKIKDFNKINKYCVEKFTLELCHDEYFDMIPIFYINPKNTIIMDALASFYNIPYLEIEAEINQYRFSNVRHTPTLTTITKPKYDMSLLELAKINHCHIYNICKRATIYGNLNVLKWGAKSGYNLNKKKTCQIAAKHGNLNVLKWARKNGCGWGDVCLYAAAYGYLDILKWARANGCHWDVTTCLNAANNGYLEILKWARTNGCQWDKYVCDYAAKNGHLEVLKWARENGCDWDKQTRIYAINNGCPEILKYVIDNACPE